MKPMPGGDENRKAEKPQPTGNLPGALRDKLSKVPSQRADYWSTVNSLQTELAQRKRRNRIFGAATFQGDCWGFFLELVNAEFDGRKMTVADLASELGAEIDVAQRAIDHLAAQSLVRGETEDGDVDPSYSLTIEGIAMMIEYFDPRVT